MDYLPNNEPTKMTNMAETRRPVRPSKPFPVSQYTVVDSAVVAAGAGVVGVACRTKRSVTSPKLTIFL